MEMSNEQMKLSEAMRIGAKLRPQAFGGSDYFEATGGTCATFAAVEALTGLVPPASFEAFGILKSTYPDFFGSNATCPECGSSMPASLILMLCLNDGHRWPRERIADWLESIGH